MRMLKTMRLYISAFTPSDSLGEPTAFENYMKIHMDQADFSNNLVIFGAYRARKEDFWKFPIVLSIRIVRELFWFYLSFGLCVVFGWSVPKTCNSSLEMGNSMYSSTCVYK